MLQDLRKKARLIRSVYFDRFVFIHINKTGGSSIEKALKLPFEHKTAIEKIQEIGRHEWDRRISFAVVRNPWDKVVSHYHYRVYTNQTGMGDGHISFNDWVRRSYGCKDPVYYDQPKMFQPQAEWLKDADLNMCVKEILRFENLAGDFNVLAEKIGKKVLLPHVKKTSHKCYKDYYDADARKIIERVFQEDIDVFKYVF